MWGPFARAGKKILEDLDRWRYIEIVMTTQSLFSFPEHPEPALPPSPGDTVLWRGERHVVIATHEHCSGLVLECLAVRDGRDTFPVWHEVTATIRGRRHG